MFQTIANTPQNGIHIFDRKQRGVGLKGSVFVHSGQV
jgi:hypothetical protein